MRTTFLPLPAALPPLSMAAQLRLAPAQLPTAMPQLWLPRLTPARHRALGSLGLQSLLPHQGPPQHPALPFLQPGTVPQQVLLTRQLPLQRVAVGRQHGRGLIHSLSSSSRAAASCRQMLPTSGPRARAAPKLHGWRQGLQCLGSMRMPGRRPETTHAYETCTSSRYPVISPLQLHACTAVG